MNDTTLSLILKGQGSFAGVIAADDPAGRAAADVLDSLVMAMRAEGIDVESPAMVRALTTTLDAIDNTMDAPEPASHGADGFAHAEIAALRAGLAAYQLLTTSLDPGLAREDLSERATDCGRVRALSASELDQLDTALCERLAQVVQHASPQDVPIAAPDSGGRSTGRALLVQRVYSDAPCGSPLCALIAVHDDFVRQLQDLQSRAKAAGVKGVSIDRSPYGWVKAPDGDEARTYADVLTVTANGQFHFRASNHYAEGDFETVPLEIHILEQMLESGATVLFETEVDEGFARLFVPCIEFTYDAPDQTRQCVRIPEILIGTRESESDRAQFLSAAPVVFERVTGHSSDCIVGFDVEDLRTFDGKPFGADDDEPEIDTDPTPGA